MLVLGVFRLAYLAVVPLELSVDEAYYWDWSRQLAWGYYSKPPMVAWLIRLATLCGGHRELAIRWPASLLGTVGLWAVFALARAQFGAKVGFWSAVAVAATPGMAAMNVLMTIDAPFLCAWAWALWSVWELLGEDSDGSGKRRRQRLWLGAAILSTGCGLLSKQTMLAIFPLTLVWLASDSEGRRQLRQPQVWLWIVGSLIFLLPVVWWNAQHNWVTLRHTQEHFQARSVDVVHKVWQGLEFVASQCGVASPLTFGLMGWLGLTALHAWPLLDRRLRFLICFSMLPLLAVLALSFTQKVQPNWPAPFHLTGIILVMAWGCLAITPKLLPAFSSPPTWLKISLMTGGLLTLGTLAVPFVLPSTPLAGSRLDPLARLRGWKSLGTQLGQMQQQLSGADETQVIAVTGRGPVSLLAFYLPGQPRVYRWNPTGQIVCQHDVWGGPPLEELSSALLVMQQDLPLPDQLARAFDRVERLGTLEASRGGSRREVLIVWHGKRVPQAQTAALVSRVPASQEQPTPTRP